MQNTVGGAVKRIFVKVFGFSDVERHALNTVFRLSESSSIAYAPWTAEAPEKAQVLLLDGQSWEAALELANPAHDQLKLIWVGEAAPPAAWRVFQRPIQWAAVVEAMDELFATPMEPDLDLDLLSEPPSEPADLGRDVDPASDALAPTDPMPLEIPAPPDASDARVLVIDAGRDDRLYWRAKLASAKLFEVDEAATGAEALQLLHSRTYRLVVVDLGLPDMDPWQLLKDIEAVRPVIENVFVTARSLSRAQAVRAWFAGAKASFAKPLHPGRLKYLLRNI